MASDTDEPAHDGDSRGWHAPVSWSLLFVVGWVLYEITTQPALAVVTICLKFGWSDFHTAFWLRGIDPIQTRGRAFFWMHLGSGFWKTALAAVVPMFAMPIIMDWCGRRPGPQAGVPDPFMGAFLTALGGFLLSAFMTAIAVVRAWWNRVPLWLNHAIHRDRRERNWPPLHALMGRPNHLGRLLLAMLFVLLFPTFSTALIVLAMATELPAAGNKGNSPAIFGVALVSGIIVAPVIMLGGRGWLLQKIAAKDPLDCWPDALIGEDEPAGDE